MLTVDCHVHCGRLDDSAQQAYEDVAPMFDRAQLDAAVCFSPVMEIYDRHDPDFRDSRDWRRRRASSRRYLLDLKNRRHRIHPFYFVWNDFDTSELDLYCGIKWHRHPDEPVYNYEDPRCAGMIEAIRERGFVVLLEEEHENAMRFVDDIGSGIPVIVPHLGRLNGGFERLMEEDFWRRPNAYADMSAGSTEERDIKTFLDRYGPERLLYGSDYPFGDSVTSKQKILSLGLPEADERLIFGGNVMRLLKHVEA